MGSPISLAPAPFAVTLTQRCAAGFWNLPLEVTLRRRGATPPGLPPLSQRRNALRLGSPGSPSAGASSFGTQPPFVCYPACWLGLANPRSVVETGSEQKPRSDTPGLLLRDILPL